MALWQISVQVPAEAEEPVAALMEAVFSEPPSIFFNTLKQRTTVTVYLSSRVGVPRAHREALQNGLRRLNAVGGKPGPEKISIAKIRREDWAESWKRHFKPIEIGGALLLKPSWSKRRPRAGQAVVVLDPGLSFGTGQHPTTRFCLEQIARVKSREARGSFLDIGTGSGILAIAAATLGYAPVRGIDSDPDAVRVACANAKQNGVFQKVRFSRSGLEEIPLKGGQKYDLICANLVMDLLLDQKARILGRLATGGRLVLAGILRSQLGQIRAEYQKSGLKMDTFKVEREWASVAFVG